MNQGAAMKCKMLYMRPQLTNMAPQDFHQRNK